MTAFIALTRKDLLLFLSNRRALVINLMLPILIGTFFGYLFGGSGKTESSRIEVAVVQLDASPVAKAVLAGLQGDPALKISVLSLDEARRQVGKGKQKLAIVIPEGFGTAAGAALFGAGPKPDIALLYDPSQQAVLSMVKGMLTQHVMQVVSSDMFNGASGQEFSARSMAALEHRADPESQALKELLGSVTRFQQRSKGSGTGSSNGAGMSAPFATRDEEVVAGGKSAGYNAYAHAFAGMGVQFILFLGIDIGIGILLARRSGIFNRLLAAPVSLQTVLLASATSTALIAMLLLTTMFGFAVLVLGVEIANPPGMLAVMIAFSLLSASFGMFIAAFGKTPEAARGLAVFATLIMVMLGGGWVPSFMFPPWVQSAAMLVPTKWAIDGFDAMTWRGLGMDAALMSSGVLIAFTAAFAALAMWQFKRQQHA